MGTGGGMIMDPKPARVKSKSLSQKNTHTCMIVWLWYAIIWYGMIWGKAGRSWVLHGLFKARLLPVWDGGGGGVGVCYREMFVNKTKWYIDVKSTVWKYAGKVLVENKLK